MHPKHKAETSVPSIAFKSVIDLTLRAGLQRPQLKCPRNCFVTPLEVIHKLNCCEELMKWQWYLDEVFVKINGETRDLWRAVDHEGEVLESHVIK